MTGVDLAAGSVVAAFLLGLVGSGHCVGMCGGLSGALGVAAAGDRAAPGARATTNAWGLALAASLGRVATYAVIGAFAGAVVGASDALLGIGPWLRIAAAALVLVMGLQLLGLPVGTDRLERLGLRAWRRIAPLAARARGRDGWLAWAPARALVLGAIWGLLPCGLVYSAAAASVVAGGPPGAALFMVAFGVGTLPAMVAAGATVGGLGAWTRRPAIRRLAGGLLVFFSAFSILSALGGVHATAHAAPGAPGPPASPSRSSLEAPTGASCHGAGQRVVVRDAARIQAGPRLAHGLHVSRSSDDPAGRGGAPGWTDRGDRRRALSADPATQGR